MSGHNPVESLELQRLNAVWDRYREAADRWKKAMARLLEEWGTYQSTIEAARRDGQWSLLRSSVERFEEAIEDA